MISIFLFFGNPFQFWHFDFQSKLILINYILKCVINSSTIVFPFLSFINFILLLGSYFLKKETIRSNYKKRKKKRNNMEWCAPRRHVWSVSLPPKSHRFDFESFAKMSIDKIFLLQILLLYIF